MCFFKYFRWIYLLFYLILFAESCYFYDYDRTKYQRTTPYAYRIHNCKLENVYSVLCNNKEVIGIDLLKYSEPSSHEVHVSCSVKDNGYIVSFIGIQKYAFAKTGIIKDTIQKYPFVDLEIHGIWNAETFEEYSHDNLAFIFCMSREAKGISNLKERFEKVFPNISKVNFFPFDMDLYYLIFWLRSIRFVEFLHLLLILNFVIYSISRRVSLYIQ